MTEWSIAVTVDFWEDSGRMILSRELAEVADNDDDEPGLETPPLELEEGLADRAPSLETPTLPATPRLFKARFERTGGMVLAQMMGRGGSSGLVKKSAPKLRVEAPKSDGKVGSWIDDSSSDG
ncbi:hypothetical protein PG984_004344 [Apiospora sp. TS-2023a]